MLTKTRFAFAEILVVIVAAGLSLARGQTCVPPPELRQDLAMHPTADVYANVGNWYAGRLQFGCAIDAFQSAHRLDPGSAHVSYLLGLSYFMAGHPADARQPLEQSVQEDSSVLKTHLVLAQVLSALHDDDTAVTQWEAALRIDPDSTLALEGISKVFLARRQADPVIALLSGARLNEDLTVDLVRALVLDYKYNDAKQLLDRAARNYPSSVAIMYAVVTLDLNQGHPEVGAHVAETFAKAHPHDLSAQKVYLRTLEFSPDPAIALPVAAHLLTIAPKDPELLYLAGMNECEAGDYEAARKHLEASVEIDPAHYRDKYNVRYYLGTALFELNQFSEARDQLEKAIEIQAPSTEEMKPQARWELALALRNLGKPDEAREQIQIYQQEKLALDNRTLAMQKMIAADTDLQHGETQKAIAHYREALAATPNDARLNYKLALALDSMGNFGDERTALLEAVNVDPTFALAQYQLGYVESQQGDSSAAEQQFRLALKAAPHYAKAWISLAATLGMESRYPEAEQAVAQALHLAPRDQEALELRKALAAAKDGH